jgi:hypothetical protein
VIVDDQGEPLDLSTATVKVNLSDEVLSELAERGSMKSLGLGFENIASAAALVDTSSVIGSVVAAAALVDTSQWTDIGSAATKALAGTVVDTSKWFDTESMASAVSLAGTFADSVSMKSLGLGFENIASAAPMVDTSKWLGIERMASAGSLVDLKMPDFGIASVVSQMLADTVVGFRTDSVPDVGVTEMALPEVTNGGQNILDGSQSEALRQRRVALVVQLTISIMTAIGIGSVVAGDDRLAAVMALLVAWLSVVYSPKR